MFEKTKKKKKEEWRVSVLKQDPSREAKRRAWSSTLSPATKLGLLCRMGIAGHMMARFYPALRRTSELNARARSRGRGGHGAEADANFYLSGVILFFLWKKVLPFRVISMLLRGLVSRDYGL